MIDINELRRLAQAATPGPWLFDEKSEAITTHNRIANGKTRIATVTLGWVEPFESEQRANARLITAANPATISELLDRLEAAEKAVTEAYQRGYATGQEEVAAELEFAKQEIANLHDDIGEWMDKCDALRTKIEQMEKQEPVAKVRVHRTGGNAGLAWSVAPLNDFDSLPLMRDGDRLYALPGAQPAPSVPDDVMRDAERYRYLRARDDDTAGVGCWLEADGKVLARGWLYGDQLDSAIDSFIEALAAAPEAKP